MRVDVGDIDMLLQELWEQFGKFGGRPREGFRWVERCGGRRFGGG